MGAAGTANPATGGSRLLASAMGEVTLPRATARGPPTRPAAPRSGGTALAGGGGPAAPRPAPARGERLTDTAARAGISPQYLSELERGRKDPSSEILAAAAGALGVPLREIVRLAHADLARGAGGRGPVLLAA